jgi:hypothetical protein
MRELMRDTFWYVRGFSDGKNGYPNNKDMLSGPYMRECYYNGYVEGCKAYGYFSEE